MRKCYFAQTSLEGNLKEFVFVNSNGTQMINTSAASTAAFTKGCKPEDRVCNTVIRKAVVTAMHAKHLEKMNDLAEQMCHLPGTATRFYRLINRQQNSRAVTILIRDTVLSSVPALATDNDKQTVDNFTDDTVEKLDTSDLSVAQSDSESVAQGSFVSDEYAPAPPYKKGIFVGFFFLSSTFHCNLLCHDYHSDLPFYFAKIHCALNVLFLFVLYFVNEVKAL